MKLTILGSSGSVSAPDNPASGYLISVDNSPSVLMDMGPGVLGKLQEIQDPTDTHVVFSHLHADHCLDFPSLLVWRRFHPTSPAKGRSLVCGPADTVNLLGRLTTDEIGQVDDLSDTFAFTPWRSGEEHLVDRVSITPYPAVHPVESYCLRVEEHTTGKVLTYSGDTGWTDSLVEAARESDVFLCEATWAGGTDPVPAGMHLSGEEAGRAARLAGVKRLVLVHIPPWGDEEATLAAACREFDGPIDIGHQGMVIDF